MKNTFDRSKNLLSEDNMMFLDEGNFARGWEISYEEAKVVSTWITQENKLHPHMVEKNPDFIFESAQKHGCIKIIDLNTDMMIGFMGLYQYGDLYEAGSLYVASEFRNQGVAGMLQSNLLSQYNHDHNIFLVTSVEYAKKINHQTDLVMVTREQLSDDILKLIESGGKMLRDDEIYANKCLLLNENFYDLNKQG